MPRYVCDNCRGRGVVYRFGRRLTCKVCGGHSPTLERARADATNALAVCWARHQKGETGDFNLELAVRGCLNVGYTIEQLGVKFKIPRQALRHAAGGQGQL